MSLAPVTDNVTDVLAAQYNELIAALKMALPGGRLTLTSGTPVTTADVAASTSIYYTPYMHNIIMLWDGTIWQPVTFTEKTLALGTVTSGLPYDVFGYLSSGDLALEKLAWTNGTTRATAISLQDGRYCKTGDKTRLYLGTFYTTSTTQTADSTTQRFLWNMYNRMTKRLVKVDSTSHTYTTASYRQWNNDAANKVEVILGLLEEYCLLANRFQMSGATGGGCGVGVNQTTGVSLNAVGSAVADLSFYPANNVNPVVGYNYFAMLELGAATVTFTLATIAGQWRC